MKTIIAAALLLGASALSAGAAELKYVGIAINNVGDPFQVTVADGATAAIKAVAPDATISVASSDYDIVKQSAQIDNFVSAGANMILVDAADPNALAPAIARAKAAGVLVVGVDAVPNGVDYSAASNDVMSGTIACTELAKRLGGKGKVVIIPGPPIPPVLDRVAGCKDVLAGYPDIELLANDQNGGGIRDGGFKVMQTLLSRFDQIDGVFVIAEEMAIGARIAATQANRTNIIITTVDGSPAIVDEMKSPDQQIVATSASRPREIGQVGAEIGIEVFNGGTPANPHQKLDPFLLTKEEVGSYKGW